MFSTCTPHRSSATATIISFVLCVLELSEALRTSPLDAVVMLQMPEATRVTALSPLVAGSEHPVGSFLQLNTRASKYYPLPALWPSLGAFGRHGLLGSAFFTICLWMLVCYCIAQREHWPWKTRPKLDKFGDPQTKCSSRKENHEHWGPDPSTWGVQRGQGASSLQEDNVCVQKNVAPDAMGPPAFVLEALKGPEIEAVPPGTGMCWCTSGIEKLIRKAPRKGKPCIESPKTQPTSASSLAPAGCKTTESVSLPLKNTSSSSASMVPFCVPLPPPSCTHEGRPDFTGTWHCVKAEGELDELLVDFGLGYLVRSAASAYGYGAGHITRTCEHKGSRMKYQEMGLEGLKKVEYDLPMEDQNMGHHLQTTYWDEAQPHVMVVEAKDLQKAKPSTWSISWQYLLDENTLIIKSSSKADHVALWVYKREGHS